MGHLLHLMGVVGDREVAKHKHESAKAGKGSFHLAWLLDATVSVDCMTNTQIVGMRFCSFFTTSSFVGGRDYGV